MKRVAAGRLRNVAHEKTGPFGAGSFFFFLTKRSATPARRAAGIALHASPVAHENTDTVLSSS